MVLCGHSSCPSVPPAETGCAGSKIDLDQETPYNPELMKIRATVAFVLLVYVLISGGLSFHSHSWTDRDHIGVHCNICQVTQKSGEFSEIVPLEVGLNQAYILEPEKPVDFAATVPVSQPYRAPPTS